MADKKFTDFDFEFYSQVEHVGDDIRNEAEDRLRELGVGYKDMIGASVAVEKTAHGETGVIYKARVVAYTKPEYIAAVEKADNVESALKAALDAVERQVRKKREKFGKPWQRPSGQAED
jgi:ribosome-associated translation inhibitor RaiA